MRARRLTFLLACLVASTGCQKIGIEITPESLRQFEVHRDGQRVISGSGRATETWSFVAPDDVDSCTRDIGAVIRASDSAAP